ncbi:MAG: SDR family NAD(P)-dependent oxidoreductase, partial [Bacteroidota bacterium]
MPLSNKDQRRLREQYGSYALITGATSGIGKEIAQQLAAAGLNLIIQGRNQEVLEEMQVELSTQYTIEVKTVAADLSHPEGVEEVIKATRNLPLGMLVASAGFGTSGTFLENSVHAEQNMMRVNMEALMLLTHHYGQLFAQQKRGGIILMSSLVAFQGTPYAANYAATKAYVQGLAEGLHVELKPHGVDVLAAATGYGARGCG